MDSSQTPSLGSGSYIHEQFTSAAEVWLTATISCVAMILRQHCRVRSFYVMKRHMVSAQLLQLSDTERRPLHKNPFTGLDDKGAYIAS